MRISFSILYSVLGPFVELQALRQVISVTNCDNIRRKCIEKSLATDKRGERYIYIYMYIHAH